MIRKIKNTIRALMGIRNDTDFYSQAGEDAIILSVTKQLLLKSNGFFVDIGAYHPFRHSNTYLLYKSGWAGVNIDPRPGSKKLFDHFRPRDLNIEAGIAGFDGEMTYYIISENSTMNTFSREHLETLGLNEKSLKKVIVPVYTFGSLIQKYNLIKEIDYMNIDAEGFEMEILQGIPFDQVLPKIISLEQNRIFGLKDVIDSDVNRFLEKRGYIPFAKNFITDTVGTVFYSHMSLSKV